MIEEFKCKTCEDTGLVEDESACGDPDHCAPMEYCPDCYILNKGMWDDFEGFYE